jgi:hypothetical protein
MIYDPRRRAIEMRHAIIETMSDEELVHYFASSLPEGSDRGASVIRNCEECRESRYLETGSLGDPYFSRCGCGVTRLDARDYESLRRRVD